MARNEYDDVDDLVKDLENEISKEVALNVAEEMKDIMIEVIDEVVYNQYTPREYRRRGEIGGLSDKNNIKEDMKVIKNGIEISIENTTKGNDRYSNAYGYTSGEISDIIESGRGYGYGLNEVIGARPFQKTTQDYINYTDRIDKIVENTLTKKGW